MALAILGLALAVPSTVSAAPAINADAIHRAIQETSPIEEVRHCRYSSRGGCYRRHYRYHRRHYRVYRPYRFYYRPRRVYRIYRIY
jgi:hypothetical protein